MSESTKTMTPPYTTYTSFDNLIKDLRENGVPEHITRSVVKGSNSGKAMMTASLKALRLIDDSMSPSEDLKQLVESEENYSKNLKKILERSYDFLFDGSIDIHNTTTEKIVEKFREAGASGSTVSKCISFFLGAAKAAEINVSARVKSPAPDRKPTKPKKAKGKDGGSANDDQTPKKTEKALHPEMEKITVPLRGMDDGVIYFPKGLDADDAKRAVKMAVFILNNFYGLDVNERGE